MPLLLTPTAGRLVRPAVAAVVTGTLLLVPGSGAWGAGTGGIEVTPLPAVVDGKPVTSFRVSVPTRGSEVVRYTVRNVEDGPRSARIYSAEVQRSSDGTFSLGAAGSSAYVAMPDREVTLAAGEVREESFTVSAPDGERPEDTEYAAVVVEVRAGSVVQRANTLIYLRPGRVVPVPVLLALGAAVLALGAGLLVLLTGRRRRAQSRQNDRVVTPTPAEAALHPPR